MGTQPLHGAQSWIADHVPPELVWDEDYFAWAARTDDPFLRVSELHDGPDILWARSIDLIQPGWLPTRQALIREILTDTEHFSSAQSNMLGVIGVDWRLIPIEFDPPQQQMYRRVLEPFFTPASVDALDGMVRKACDELIEAFPLANGCEFCGEFAERFPSHVFLDLMGMPRERLGDFLKWERDMLRPHSFDEQKEAMLAILHYMQDFLSTQREAPSSPLMEAIVNARYNNERPLTDDEMTSVCYLLYIGGLDTVYCTLGWIMRHLAQDPALQERLRDHPEEIPRAVEELLRAFSAASSQRRVIKDLDFHGVPMRAGDVIQLSLPLASRDPQAYDDPHRIDIDRPARHVAFGTGPHTCLGLRLARREIRIVLESFLSRFHNIRLADGERYEFHTGSVFGVDRLHLEWDI